jgi:hypothetical protein
MLNLIEFCFSAHRKVASEQCRLALAWGKSALKLPCLLLLARRSYEKLQIWSQESLAKGLDSIQAHPFLAELFTKTPAAGLHNLYETLQTGGIVHIFNKKQEWRLQQCCSQTVVEPVEECW